MIILIDAKIALTKPSMIKTQKKLGIEGIYFDIIKATYVRLVADIILNGEKQEVLPQKSGARQGCLLLFLTLHLVLEVLAIAIR